MKLYLGKKKRISLLTIFCGILWIAYPSNSFGQDTFDLDNNINQSNVGIEKKEGGLESGNDLRELLEQPVPEMEEGTPQSQRRYIYESATVSTLSHLYWALGMMDYDNNVHIDNFLRLNECDIYQQYAAQEFEWQQIRESTITFIKKNKSEFPTRFELVIPVRLQGYDPKRNAFRIVDQDQVLAARRFELLSKDYSRMICWIKTKEIPGYPKGLIMELSRPFSLTYVPAPPDRAKIFIKEKDEIFQSYTAQGKSKARLLDLRTAYLIMQLKIFAHRGITKGRHGLNFVRVMAVLEGFEIYGDIRRKNLFYTKSFLKLKNKLEESEKLQTEMDILRKKSEEDGLLN